MTINDAISKAIEGGYADHAYCNEFDMYEGDSSYCHSTVLLDAAFWQSLGKAMLWSEYATCQMCGKQNCHNYKFHKYAWKSEYLYHWHRFIDHLAQGGSAESFFEQLA